MFTGRRLAACGRRHDQHSSGDPRWLLTDPGGRRQQLFGVGFLVVLDLVKSVAVPRR